MRPVLYCPNFRVFIMIRPVLQSEVEELKNMSAMLDAMTAEELERPESIRAAAKERIATAAGKVRGGSPCA